MEEVLSQIEGDQMSLSDAQNIKYYIDTLREKNIYVSDIDNISGENKKQIEDSRRHLINEIMCSQVASPNVVKHAC